LNPLPEHRWHGIFPSLPTPFAAGDRVDVVAQRRIVRFALDAGAHGFLCFGLAGEVFRLTAGDRLELLEAIVDETDGRVPVCAGVGTEASHSSIALARASEAAGANALVVPPPITANPSRRELLHYFEAVAGAVSLPVVIQDAPEYLRIEVGRDIVDVLLERCPNVRMVKLECGPDMLGEWTRHFGERLAVFGGSGGLYLPDSLVEGVAGIAPGTDLVDLLVAVYEAWIAGETDAAAELFGQVAPTLIFELQSIDHYNACAKHVLRRRGVVDADHLRAPAAELTAGARRLLDNHLDRLGVTVRESAS
jgi:dihydrodipicolinate synthase/N-acetylneuraminate lyase